MDKHNVVHQKALQQLPHFTQQHRFSGEAMLAASNNNQLHQIKNMINSQIPTATLTFVDFLLVPMKTMENTSWQE